MPSITPLSPKILDVDWTNETSPEAEVVLDFYRNFINAEIIQQTVVWKEAIRAGRRVKEQYNIYIRHLQPTPPQELVRKLIQDYRNAGWDIEFTDVGQLFLKIPA